ncbi:MAG: hypothetical protein QG670_2193 [Thermoproteota archaeon]|nr:hypothetical protein [Thermoproteota archaeon]
MVKLAYKVKITVLRRFDPSEVFKEPPMPRIQPSVACSRNKDGQEFIVGEDGKISEGFCPGAWVSIYPSITLLRFGGDLPQFKEKGVDIQSCTDGLRPVIFKLERI